MGESAPGTLKLRLKLHLITLNSRTVFFSSNWNKSNYHKYHCRNQDPSDPHGDPPTTHLWLCGVVTAPWCFFIMLLLPHPPSFLVPPPPSCFLSLVSFCCRVWFYYNVFVCFVKFYFLSLSCSPPLCPTCSWLLWCIKRCFFLCSSSFSLFIGTRVSAHHCLVGLNMVD